MEWSNFYVDFFTETTSMYDGETDSENKLQAIIDKTRSLQDAIKNVTTNDLNISEDDLESPGHSAEDLSDVMSDKDGNPEHVDTMDQDVYGRFLDLPFCTKYTESLSISTNIFSKVLIKSRFKRKKM